MVVLSSLIGPLALALSTTTQAYVIKIDHHDGDVKAYDVDSTGNLTAEEFLASPRAVRYHREVIEDRDVPCASGTQFDHYYEIIGNGNPHQNYKIAQVANTLISCPGTVTTGESHTFGWSVGGSLNPGPEKYDFASVGFSVSESDTKIVTDAFECEGGMTEICAFHYTAVTAVSVEFWVQQKGCTGNDKTDLGPGTVYLPNANGIGSTISRGTNFGDRNIIQCRGQDEREVDFFCGPAGGPEWFDTHQYGPWSDAYQGALDPAGCAVPIEALKFNS